MTDKQLDEIDQAMSDGAVTWYQLERLTAETRRLRELERAVRAMREECKEILAYTHTVDGQAFKQLAVTAEALGAALAACDEACRLFSELKEADGIVTTQWVTDQKRELTQDTATYRKLITQEWPDKQEAEGE